MVNLPYTHACGDPQQIISSKFSVVRLFIDLCQITENNDSPEKNIKIFTTKCIESLHHT